MNHLKFCSCKMCKTGMHNCAHGEYTARQAVRRHRHKAKEKLNQVDLDTEDVVVENIISVGYTD